jgi:hypothetical protein
MRGSPELVHDHVRLAYHDPMVQVAQPHRRGDAKVLARVGGWLGTHGIVAAPVKGLAVGYLQGNAHPFEILPEHCIQRRLAITKSVGKVRARFD